MCPAPRSSFFDGRIKPIVTDAALFPRGSTTGFLVSTVLNKHAKAAAIGALGSEMGKRRSSLPESYALRGALVVEGTNPDGERVLVLWRDLDELDNNALDEWFTKQGYSTRDLEYDLVYVNGDNNLENLRRPDQTWKVRLIDEEFQRLMFDVEDL